MVRADEMDIKHYGVVLRRWRRLILGVAAVSMGLAFVLNLVLQPVYQATTRLEIRKEPTRSPITGELVSDDFQTENAAVFTTVELMTSRELMRHVATTLRERELLQMNAPRAEFFRRLRERLAFGGADPAVAVGEVEDASHVAREVDWLLEILTIKPVRDTRIIRVQVEHWNPRIARAIADVLASEFVAFQSDQRSAADTLRLGTLRGRIQSARGEISELEEQLTGQAGLPVLEERVRQLGGTLSGLNASLVRAQTERLEVEARLGRLRPYLDDPEAGGAELPITGTTIDGLWRDLLARRTDLARAREVFKEQHPRVLMLETELRAIRDNIRTELNKTIAGFESQRSMLAAQERSLRTEVGRSEGELRQVSTRIGRSSTLESQLKTKREFHDLLSGRVQEGEIVSSGVRLPLVRIVEPATVGPDPVRPRRALNLLLGLAVGLFGGTGLALFLEYLRRAIRTPNDVAEYLQMPVIGMIPKRPA